LISASGAGNTASYAYDAQGRRKSKTAGSTTTLLVQDLQGRALFVTQIHVWCLSERRRSRTIAAFLAAVEHIRP